MLVLENHLDVVEAANILGVHQETAKRLPDGRVKQVKSLALPPAHQSQVREEQNRAKGEKRGTRDEE